MAQAIADAPALLAEARDALPALRSRAVAKSGTDGVRRVIAKRFAIYPQPVRNEEEWAEWWAAYYGALADVSLAQLEAAMRAYVELPDSEFMPKPGKLLELAKVTPCMTIQRYHRAKRAETLAIEAQAVPGERADPAEVRKMLDEFRAGKVERQRPPRPMPYTGGIPDERGVTPQMRELMARQRGEA